MAAVLGLAACLAAATADGGPTDPALRGQVPPDVAERNGAILYYTDTGRECPLTPQDRFTQPELSPDGKTVAMIREDKEGEPASGEARSSLWLVDVNSGARRQLVAARYADDLTANLSAMGQPQFSLNGGFVYVMAEAWVTSHAIHQVNVKTGAHRFVTDGELLFVIRYGKYAGYLAVQKHRYHGAPDYGSYDPVYIVRPDNKWSMMVPGSDKDDGDTSLELWLKRNGG